MTQFWRFFNLLILGVLLLICGLGTFYKHLSFGLGLGDMFGYFVLYVGTFIHAVLTFSLRKKEVVRTIILSLSFLIFTILMVLNATIWRSALYPWNGSIFFLSCPREIVIEHQNTQKSELIRMCTMDYYSEFTGTWRAPFLILKNGAIKVPKELQQYLHTPITKVALIPHALFWGIENPDRLHIPYDFRIDTLQPNHIYRFTGDISAIKNGIPTINAKIRLY